MSYANIIVFKRENSSIELAIEINMLNEQIMLEILDIKFKIINMFKGIHFDVFKGFFIWFNHYRTELKHHEFTFNSFMPCNNKICYKTFKSNQERDSYYLKLINSLEYFIANNKHIEGVKI